jgi:ADP-heptose:LPS heptosyltransferase
MKILLIQTAFIGDVILATALLEKLHTYFPEAKIDCMVRKGNESLLANHPFLHQVLVWDKQGGKYKNWWKLLKAARATQYDLLVNVQRFASMGIFTALAGAKKTIGFAKTPFSLFFTEKYTHQIGNGKHEIERNQLLISNITDAKPALPRLYPTLADEEKIKDLKVAPYVCLAPASVWHTKQFPKHKWVDLIGTLFQKNKEIQFYLLGSKGDTELCQLIEKEAIKQNSTIKIAGLSGKLGLLASAALMRGAQMNYANDSAPMHLASAVNAPICAVFCSTIPDFGFTPLSSNAKVVQVSEKLSCRPCGLHGHKTCPQGHFRCAEDIKMEQFF